jgi:hypothetical protein
VAIAFPFRRRGCGSCEANENATSAGLDGAVFESGVYRARPLAARGRRAARSLQQLRLPASQRAATARAALPYAAAPTGQLSPGRTPAIVFHVGIHRAGSLVLRGEEEVARVLNPVSSSKNQSCRSECRRYKVEDRSLGPPLENKFQAKLNVARPSRSDNRIRGTYVRGGTGRAKGAWDGRILVE